MNFYKKKVGRPTQEEQVLIQAISEIIEQKGIPIDEIPMCQSLEDLIEVKLLVDAYTPKVEETDVLEKESVEIQEKESTEHESQVNEALEQTQTDGNEELDLENEKTIETTEKVETIESQSDIDIDDILKSEHPSFVSEDYNPFEAPIIERSYTSQSNAEKSTDSSNNSSDDVILEETKEPTPLDSNLNHQTKKKAAEQTANTILKGYAKLVPKPFKWFAKVNESKVEELSFEGELDLSIEVSEGVTFDDYMKQTNEQIDEIFEVQEETLDEIKEPLIEVLMEQELELTPQQRLGMAVISHLVQMFTIAIKLRNQNNRILSYQKHLTSLNSQGSKMA